MMDPREVLSLSSGTIHTLTGIAEYEEIDKIQFEFYEWVLRQKKTFENWQSAWNTFKEEEKEMSKDTQMGYANIINEIADTIGQAEQINERMWREEVITHDRKRYFIIYEFTDEEITEAKACDDPAQFEEFLPYDERHVYEVEEI